MRKSDFFYDLPQELIAQTPLEKRDDSRLLRINRISKEMTDSYFYNICDFLEAGDLLVLNDSKVFPARLYGKKRSNGIVVEFLLLEQKENNLWETMVRPGRRLKTGTIVDFAEGLSAEIISEADGGNRYVSFNYDTQKYSSFYEILGIIGQMPLPPYITEKLENKERYNTVYSREIGSSAAPTAGLHFTDEVFENLSKKGIDTTYVTLHVGLGTFRPVKSDNILEHKMHIEHFVLPSDTAEKINNCKKNGGRVIAVGTTACRVLESMAENSEKASRNGNTVNAGSGETGIFIYPGYKFKIIDGLITNFHLPESTLIMLVSAFLGRENTLNAYRHAIENQYRFFSFGDSMFII